MFWFLTRLFQKPIQRPDLHLRFYSREGCHLCDDALAEIRQLQKKHGFTLEVLDVDTSKQWQADFGNCVPVVQVNDKVRFRGRFNRVLFQRLLDARPDPKKSPPYYTGQTSQNSSS